MIYKISRNKSHHQILSVLTLYTFEFFQFSISILQLLNKVNFSSVSTLNIKLFLTNFNSTIPKRIKFENTLRCNTLELFPSFDYFFQPRSNNF